MERTPQSVLAAADALVSAFGNHDVDAYFSAFAAEATFIFHNLDRMLSSRAEYEEEWRLWEARDGFRVLRCASSERHVRMLGATAIFTHRVETQLALAGQTVSNVEFETIVFARADDGRWVAVHEHLSALPCPTPPG